MQVATTIISAIAIAVAIGSTWYNGKTVLAQTRAASNDVREATQAANFTRIHELLVDPKAASGRRLLFSISIPKDCASLSDADWDKINYSLALYDTLGGYVKHRLVDPDLALTLWRDPLVRIAPRARTFAEHRRHGGPTPPWEFLMDLLKMAENYATSSLEDACPRDKAGGQ